jgi:hypothetical protein
MNKTVIIITKEKVYSGPVNLSIQALWVQLGPAT